MVFPGSDSLFKSLSSLMPMLISAVIMNVFRPKDIKYKVFSSPTLTQKCLINDQVYLIFKKSVLPATQITLGIIYIRSCLGHL